MRVSRAGAGERCRPLRSWRCRTGGGPVRSFEAAELDVADGRAFLPHGDRVANGIDGDARRRGGPRRVRIDDLRGRELAVPDDGGRDLARLARARVAPHGRTVTVRIEREPGLFRADDCRVIDAVRRLPAALGLEAPAQQLPDAADGVDL